ncbi:MAG: LPS export ABC transporter periplasmic protein LptC [Proteobacteria bacterium]|nr:LPS export ABC transporter periplasmic protein LptC [Pseudomonadota bacterium]
MNGLTVVQANGTAGRRDHRMVGRDDGMRRFQVAMRHSRVVRRLRVLLPVAIVIAVAVAVFMTWFNPLRALMDLPRDAGKMVISGTRLTMEQPRISGQTRDSRAYELTAEAASQDILKPDIVELSNVRASFALVDQGTVEIAAPNGVYDRSAEILKLEKDVRIKSTAGYEWNLREATIDVRRGAVVSEQPVEVKLSSGTVSANRVEVSNNGEVIRFDGNVRTNLRLGGVAPAPAPAAAPPR